MKGQRVGYVRVSTIDQNTDRQLDGQVLDRKFQDKASGKDAARPALQAALAYLRQGDELVVHSMDRLARNLEDLRRMVRELVARGVKVTFLKENLTFSDEASPMATLMLSVMGAFAEFERSLIRERQREGIRLAKEKGVYRGRKRKLSAEQGRAAPAHCCGREEDRNRARVRCEAADAVCVFESRVGRCNHAAPLAIHGWC